MKKQDERRTYGEDRFPMGWSPCKFHQFHSPRKLTNQTLDSVFIRQTFERERERGRDTIRFPCSDASIKYSIQQVTIVAKQRERNCWMPFLVAQYLTLKAVFDETVYVSDSEVIELSLSLSLVLYSYARTCINKILSTDYETSGFMDQRFINNSSEEDSTRERPSFYRTNL